MPQRLSVHLADETGETHVLYRGVVAENQEIKHRR
jgi:hypothetical protein